MPARTDKLRLLADVDVITTPPTNGQALLWDVGLSRWVPGAATGGTDLGWFNVMDYGATGGGVIDDTAAVQAAIDAAEAAGGGVVYFPPGVYKIAGALQDTGRSNSQLVLPIVDAVDSEQITIEFRGAFPPPPVMSVVGATPIPDGHSVILGTLNAGVGGALLGGWGPSGSFDDFTFVMARFRDLTFRMPSNPVLSALNLSHVTAIDIDNVIVDCGSYYVQGLTEPTTNTSVGIKCPINNNGAYTRLGAVNVVGFDTGYEFSEHTVGQQVAAWGCKIGAKFLTATNHASHIQRFMTVHCERGIQFTGYHPVTIEQFNIEHAASGWWVTDYDIDDASNYGVGDVTWHVVLAGVGPDDTFTINGATNLNITQLGTPATGGASGKSGVVTLPSGATSVDVTHEAGTTPELRDLSVVAGSTLDAASFFWVDNIGASTFRVNVDAAPASDILFGWSYVQLTEVVQPAPSITETFSNTDGTNLHGKATTTGGKTWTVGNGTFDCNSGKGRATAVTGSAYATIASGLADFDMSCDVLVAAGTVDGVIFRMVDGSNYWRVDLQASNDRIVVARAVAGVETNYISGTFTVDTGVTYVVRVTGVAGAINVYVDGVLRRTISDTTHATATKHGIIAASTTTRFDNLTLT